MKPNQITAILAISAVVIVGPARAQSFFFSSGFNPDGKIGMLARTPSSGLETETADDFILSQPTSIDHASFLGLIPTGASLADVKNVEIEFYHVFPKDSTEPPSGNVPSRVNSPADVEIASATREEAAGSLSAVSTLLNPSFTVQNTVVNGIHKFPNQTTHGEGPATGQEVLINVAFNNPVVLPVDHYFFRPEVDLSNGNFLLLSGPKPIVPPGTPFSPDLQAWIRNADLKPDWLRVGTDIIGGDPAPQFNMEFSLSGAVVPEPTSLALLGFGAIMSLFAMYRHRSLRS